MEYGLTTDCQRARRRRKWWRRFPGEVRVSSRVRAVPWSTARCPPMPANACCITQWGSASEHIRGRRGNAGSQSRCNTVGNFLLPQAATVCLHRSKVWRILICACTTCTRTDVLVQLIQLISLIPVSACLGTQLILVLINSTNVHFVFSRGSSSPANNLPKYCTMDTSAIQCICDNPLKPVTRQNVESPQCRCLL